MNPNSRLKEVITMSIFFDEVMPIMALLLALFVLFSNR